MIRIFSILSAFTIVMILIAGGGIYWLLQMDVDQAKQTSTEAVAKGLALGISSQVNTLQDTVSKMATTDTVISAVESKDPQQLAQTALMLETILPRVMKIRILLADVSELDETSIPHMGNADLVMVRDTLSNKQNPFIQGEGNNRHLAITAAIKSNNVVIGVILASLEFDFLQPSLNKFQFSEMDLDVKQGNTTLAKVGNPSTDTNTGDKVKIEQTAWSIYYQPGNIIDVGALSVIICIILLPVLLACMAFFVSYRNLTADLRQDQGSILKAAKDLISGKGVGSYPINISEMKVIISTLIQFKRVLDNEGKEFSTETDDTEIDDFFDEPEGISFLEMDAENEESIDSFQTAESSPISLSLTEEQTSAAPPSIFSSDSKPLIEKNKKSTIFRAYDIRGIVEKTLTKDIVFDIGRAIGSEAKGKNIKTIVVGRDGRTSSPTLLESLTKGIVSTGVNILDIGLVPSPVVYFVIEHTEGKSGVVITGSHNPAEYNGLKITIDGETLAGDKIQQLKQRIDSENYLSGETGSIEQNDVFTNEYIGMISEDIHIVRPMKVVVDCGNGAAGELGPILLKTLGCEVIELFCDIDGTFPNHHPDPSKPENLSDLITAVQHYNADVGIAFDGDGDRIGVVDCKGKIIWPDRQMMLFAKEVLALKPGAEVIYDIKCSRHLGEQIVKEGGRPIMWKSGHSFIKAKIKETGAVLAGEMSGHIFFNDRWFGFDDALYSASRLIEILSADTRNSDEVFADFPDSINTPEITIELAEGESVALMEQLFAIANFNDGNIINIDGMRVDFANGWGLVRASNTIPALVLRFEADDIETLKQIQSQFKELLHKVKPGLTIPF